MPKLPAVCPLCAHVQELDSDALPQALLCPGCGASLSPKRHGAALLLEHATLETPPAPAPEPTEKPEVEALLQQAQQEKRPERAHKLLLKALEADPDSFAANRALLYHGKLYECLKRPGDYSLIKCYLLNLFEEPHQYSSLESAKIVEELFRDPLLRRTRELSGDPAAFDSAYLLHLSREYVRIFLHGRSGIGRGMLGFPRSADTVQSLVKDITDRMCANIIVNDQLTEAQQDALCAALDHARRMP